MKVTVDVTQVSVDPHPVYSFQFFGQTITVSPYNHPDVFYQIHAEWEKIRAGMTSEELAKEIKNEQ